MSNKNKLISFFIISKAASWIISEIVLVLEQFRLCIGESFHYFSHLSMQANYYLVLVLDYSLQLFDGCIFFIVASIIHLKLSIRLLELLAHSLDLWFLSMNHTIKFLNLLRLLSSFTLVRNLELLFKLTLHFLFVLYNNLCLRLAGFKEGTRISLHLLSLHLIFKFVFSVNLVKV